MLMLTISTDVQHTSRSTNAQSSRPAPLARFAADMYPASPQPEQCLQPWVTTAPALSSCPINKTFAPPGSRVSRGQMGSILPCLGYEPRD